MRVGFIGVGNRGSTLLRNMLTVPGIKVVAICDLDPARLKAAIDSATAAGHSPDGYAEYRKLLERNDIDAVVIATPVDLHKGMAIAALEVGKNVYCGEADGGDAGRLPQEVVNAHLSWRVLEGNLFKGGLPTAARSEPGGVDGLQQEGEHRQGAVP